MGVAMDFSPYKQSSSPKVGGCNAKRKVWTEALPRMGSEDTPHVAFQTPIRVI
jgi:hypothetical protein